MQRWSHPDAQLIALNRPRLPERNDAVAAIATLDWTPERLNAVRGALVRLLVSDVPRALDDLDRYTAQAASLATSAPAATTTDADGASPATCTLHLDWSEPLIHQVCQAPCHALDAMEDELAAAGKHTGRRSRNALIADQANVWAAYQDLQNVVATQRWTGVKEVITP